MWPRVLAVVPRRPARVPRGSPPRGRPRSMQGDESVPNAKRPRGWSQRAASSVGVGGDATALRSSAVLWRYGLWALGVWCRGRVGKAEGGLCASPDAGSFLSSLVVECGEHVVEHLPRTPSIYFVHVTHTSQFWPGTRARALLCAHGFRARLLVEFEASLGGPLNLTQSPHRLRPRRPLAMQRRRSLHRRVR